jgi:hypothetical protein
MKAADVRILPALEPGESYIDPSFVLVETTADAAGEPLTTIHHVSSGPAGEGGDGWKVTTLGHSAQLSHAAACEWAVSYAASRNIPLVYECDETQRGVVYAAALKAGSPALSESAAK